MLQQRQRILQAKRRHLLLQPQDAHWETSDPRPSPSFFEQQQEQQQQAPASTASVSSIAEQSLGIPSATNELSRSEGPSVGAIAAADAAAATTAAAIESRFSQRESSVQAAAAAAGGTATHVSSVGLPLPANLAALEKRMQQALKQARRTLNQQTGGALPEYGETGRLPMLCGTWQVSKP